MQQPQPMIPVIPSFPPNNITTEQIQKYLDENKKLILAILDNQNLGKLAECAQYQAQLQKNLMYLAAIADAQPQAPAMPPQHMQISAHPAMTQGGFYVQHPQAPSMGQQQPGIFPSKMPLQFNNLHHHIQEHQQQQQILQHQAALQGQMGVRPGGPNNGMNPMHGGEANIGVGGSSSSGPPVTSNQNDRNKQQDGSDVGGPSNANGSSAGGGQHTGGEGSEEGK